MFSELLFDLWYFLSCTVETGSFYAKIIALVFMSVLYMDQLCQFSLVSSMINRYLFFLLALY